MEMNEKWQLPCAAAFSRLLRLADGKPVSSWTRANQFKVGFAKRKEVVVMATASLNIFHLETFFHLAPYRCGRKVICVDWPISTSIGTVRQRNLFFPFRTQPSVRELRHSPWPRRCNSATNFLCADTVWCVVVFLCVEVVHRRVNGNTVGQRNIRSSGKFISLSDIGREKAPERGKEKENGL
jgi:hypothetical protein